MISIHDEDLLAVYVYKPELLSRAHRARVHDIICHDRAAGTIIDFFQVYYEELSRLECNNYRSVTEFVDRVAK